jgi:hypothetical protein
MPGPIKTKPGDQRGARAGQTTSPQPHGGSIGQKPYEPNDRDREYVSKHSFLMGQEATARVLGISKGTLVRHYRAELDGAEDRARLELGQTAMKKASEGDSAMLRFVLATRFADQWSPKYRMKHEGGINVSTISAEQLERMFEGKSKDEIGSIIAGLDAIIAAGGVDQPGDGSADPELRAAEETGT